MEMKKEALGNASWRIDSEEEHALAIKADESDDAKKAYVEFYRRNAPAYHEKGIQMINQMIDVFRGGVSKEKREFYTMDMLYSLHRFGCMYDEYFLMNFEALNARGRDEFVTDKNRWYYYEKLNEKKYNMVFKDKSQTFKLFEKYYQRSFLEVKSEEDFSLFCAFRKKNPTFIVKPSLGSGGKGVYVEERSDLEDRDVFDQLLQIVPVVIEELIVQPEVMRVLHPKSVNTVRVPTIRKADGNVIVFHPFIRIGVGDSVVDNAASGGIFAPVDPETGRITQAGITERGIYHIRHPESGIFLPGFQIPDWDKAVEMVTELSAIVPECHYVGWDCAYTNKGWIMVEGNLHGQFVDQFATKRGIKRELDEIVHDLSKVNGLA